MTTQQETGAFQERVVNSYDYTPEIHVTQITKVDNRGRNRYVNRPELWLKGENETIKLYGRPMRKLVSNYMGYGYRNLCAKLYRNVPREILNSELDLSYKGMYNNNIKLQEVGDRVMRLTTDAFEGISNTEVESIVDRRLDAEGIKFEKSGRFYGAMTQYKFSNTFTEFRDKISGAMTFLNRNTGENSMKFAGGGNVEVCSNGMIMGELTSNIKMVHKLEFAEVEKRIENSVGEVLAKLEVVPKHLMALKEISVTKPEAIEVISNLNVSKYVSDTVQERLWTKSQRTQDGRMDWDGTLFGVYMAMTYVGSNFTELQKTKFLSIPVNIEHASKLQDMSTLKQAWEIREKELEKTNAMKVEQ